MPDDVGNDGESLAAQIAIVHQKGCALSALLGATATYRAGVTELPGLLHESGARRRGRRRESENQKNAEDHPECHVSTCCHLLRTVQSMLDNHE